MYQILKFKEPIPSSFIHALEYDENSKEWTYCYALNTPFELTNENTKELLIYEFICDLHLEENSTVNDESVNIKIKTLDEYLRLLDLQIEVDKKYRKDWLEENKNNEEVNTEPNTFSIENRDYTYEELRRIGINYISFLVESDKEISIFAGV